MDPSLYYDQNIACVASLEKENYQKYKQQCVEPIGDITVFDPNGSQRRLCRFLKKSHVRCLWNRELLKTTKNRTQHLFERINALQK